MRRLRHHQALAQQRRELLQMHVTLNVLHVIVSQPTQVQTLQYAQLVNIVSLVNALSLLGLPTVNVNIAVPVAFVNVDSNLVDLFILQQQMNSPRPFISVTIDDNSASMWENKTVIYVTAALAAVCFIVVMSLIGISLQKYNGYSTIPAAAEQPAARIMQRIHVPEGNARKTNAGYTLLNRHNHL
jgi:hypothetical protein